MPSVTEIRTRYLLTAAEAAKVTATANLVTANADADTANTAIIAAVRTGGYDSFRIESGVVKVPDRLRGWSAGSGVLATSWTSMGLDSLVSTFTTAKALQTKRHDESAGLEYVISCANGMLADGIDKEPETAAADLTELLSTLSDIQTSMAE